MQTKFITKIILFAFLTYLLCAAPVFSEISVYDDNDQYLGVLIDLDFSEEQSVFIPQFGLPVWFEDDWTIFSKNYLYFETDDCSGIPYLLDDSAKHQYIFKGPCDAENIYYSVSNTHKLFIPKSRINLNCDCQNISANEPQDCIELSIFQESSFPFTLPVATPIHFKYISGGDINGDGKIGIEEAVNALQVSSGIKN